MKESYLEQRRLEMAVHLLHALHRRIDRRLCYDAFERALVEFITKNHHRLSEVNAQCLRLGGDPRELLAEPQVFIHKPGIFRAKYERDLLPRSLFDDLRREDARGRYLGPVSTSFSGCADGE